MMPRLEAEETLARADATALGSGVLERADAQRLDGDLRRRARGGAAARSRPDPGALAAIGIGVTVVEPNGDEAGP